MSHNPLRKAVAFNLAMVMFLLPVFTMPQSAKALQYDRETGLYYNQARMYNPRLGRFMQRDPHQTALILMTVMLKNAKTPMALASMSVGGQYFDGMNLYQYARSNPINMLDPSGEFLPFLLIAGAMIGAIFGGTAQYTMLKAQAADLNLSRREMLLSIAMGAGIGAMFGVGIVVAAPMVGGLFGVGAGGGALALTTMAVGTSVTGGAVDAIFADDELDRELGKVRFSLGGIFIMGAFALGGSEPAGIARVSMSRWPQAAQHIVDAQNAGQPRVLTLDRAGASGRRGSALGGRSKIPGLDLDEYPPAMFKEGGKRASVRAIDFRQNRGVGSSIMHQVKHLPDGSRVRIEVVP